MSKSIEKQQQLISYLSELIHRKIFWFKMIAIFSFILFIAWNHVFTFADVLLLTVGIVLVCWLILFDGYKCILKNDKE